MQVENSVRNKNRSYLLSQIDIKKSLVLTKHLVIQCNCKKSELYRKATSFIRNRLSKFFNIKIFMVQKK